MKLVTGLAMVVLGMVAMSEREARAQCTEAQIHAIANYYWTVKPLCQTQQKVLCKEEAPNDPKSPCRANATCMKYILLCSSGSTQSAQQLTDDAGSVPASLPSEEPPQRQPSSGAPPTRADPGRASPANPPLHHRP